jgi:hypothetical protein
MMENFSHILQRLPIATNASSSSDQFGGTSPFKVQVNFYISVFEGQIDVDALEKWLNLLEKWFDYDSQDNLIVDRSSQQYWIGGS